MILDYSLQYFQSTFTLTLFWRHTVGWGSLEHHSSVRHFFLCKKKEKDRTSSHTVCEQKCDGFTSRNLGPAGVEAAAAHVHVWVEAHGDSVAGAGDLHGVRGGAAQFSQLWGQQVRAPQNLRNSSTQTIDLTDLLGVILVLGLNSFLG